MTVELKNRMTLKEVKKLLLQKTHCLKTPAGLHRPLYYQTHSRLLHQTHSRLHHQHLPLLVKSLNVDPVLLLQLGVVRR